MSAIQRKPFSVRIPISDAVMSLEDIKCRLGMAREASVYKWIRKHGLARLGAGWSRNSFEQIIVSLRREVTGGK